MDVSELEELVELLEAWRSAHPEETRLRHSATDLIDHISEEIEALEEGDIEPELEAEHLEEGIE